MLNVVVEASSWRKHVHTDIKVFAGLITEEAYAGYIELLFNKVFKKEVDHEGNTVYRCVLLYC